MGIRRCWTAGGSVHANHRKLRDLNLQKNIAQVEDEVEHLVEFQSWCMTRAQSNKYQTSKSAWICTEREHTNAETRSHATDRFARDLSRTRNDNRGAECQAYLNQHSRRIHTDI